MALHIPDEAKALEMDLWRLRLRVIARSDSGASAMFAVAFAASIVALLVIGAAIAGAEPVGATRPTWVWAVAATAFLGTAFMFWRAEALRRAELDLRLSQFEAQLRLAQDAAGERGQPEASPV